MIYRRKCAICGKEFVSSVKTALYCTPYCKGIAQREAVKERERQKKEQRKANFEERRKRFIERQRRLVVVKKQGESLFCDGCVWRSWADHTRCVMPKCLRGIDGDRKKTAL